MIGSYRSYCSHRSTLLLAAVVTLSLPSTLGAQEDGGKPRYDDPAHVDADYAVQGEYRGTLGERGGWGVQVIARGGGTFEAYGYPGGLPGDGWDVEGGRSPVYAGKTDGDSTRFTGPEAMATVRDGVMTIHDLAGNPIGKLERVVRESPTLGSAPPEGAVVLFRGPEDVEKWNGGKVTGDGLLRQGTTSRETFQDHFLHLEFRTPYCPHHRGQDRGNSGCYLQGRYEVQVLDSFGERGEHNETGGIYSVAAPRLNICFPPLTWQTYDVEFRAARFDAEGKRTEPASMTVWLNGVLVHDRQEIEDTETTAAPQSQSPEPGPVYLQGHDNPVVYRNIWALRR